MNVQQQILSVAATATLVGMAYAAPASAITLTTTNYIQGDGSTVEFGFVGSYGGFQSKVGIFNVTTGEYFDIFSEQRSSSVGGNAWHANKGILDNATFAQDIDSIQSQFTFSKGHEYSFFLGSATDFKSPTVYSTTSLNQNTSWVEFGQQAKFLSDLSVLDDVSYKYIKAFEGSGITDSTQSLLAQASGTSASLSLGITSLIAFEDNGIRNPSTNSTSGFHRDFNDFLFTATVVDDGVSVPEPATMLGLGMFAGCMALSSRRRKTQDKVS